MAEFTKIKNQIAKLRAATPAAQEKAILNIIKINEQAILDMNRKQLLEGIDADGNKLMSYRNPDYARMKRRMNARGVTDLKLTGSFHRQMFLIADRFPIAYASKDSKTLDLVSKYGARIFGLTEENKELVAEKILQEHIILYYANLFQL